MKAFKTKFQFDNHFYDDPQSYGLISLYQLGDLCSQPGYEGISHHQPCNEITFIVDGSGTSTLNHKRFRIRSGDIFLSPEGTEHHIRSSNAAPLHFYYLSFSLNKEHPEYPRFKKIDELFSKIKNPVAADRYSLMPIFTLLFREFDSNSVDRDVIMETGLKQLLLLILRNFDETPQDTPKWTSALKHDRKKQLTHDVVSYINHNLMRIKSLTEISDYLGFSYSYMSRAFKETMGISLSDYYRQKQMQKAVELLEQGVSATRVSNMLGFNMVQAFSRAFKKYHGVSPSQYTKTQCKS